jgi:hypothetical protein
LEVKLNPADGTDSNPDIGVRDYMKPGSRDIVGNLIQGDQKVSAHLMITIQKVTSNVQSVPGQSPDIY